ncbi:acyl carrier protein [Spirillospora sp. CA-294931]|uniref:acyl carrier protein n=1 Tax=Spirillospora sp. CA-294931 TaxID=3240042 RepID=UPI003D8CFE85
MAERIGALIEELVGRRIAVGENFFEAGLTSLTLVRLHEAITERLDIDLPATALFTYPNLGALAAHLSEPSEPAPREPVRGGRTGGSRREVRARLRRDRGTPR